MGGTRRTRASTLAARSDAEVQDASLLAVSEPATAPSHSAPNQISCDFLSNEEKDRLLQKYALVCPALSQEIADIAAEPKRKKPLYEADKLLEAGSFEEYSRTICQILTFGYSSLLGFSKPGSDDEAADQIHGCLDLIENRVDEYQSFFETNRDAVSTLCDIGKMFCSEQGVLSSSGRWNAVCNRIPELLMQILVVMEPYELWRLRNFKDKDGIEISTKLDRLTEDADDRRIMSDLYDCYDTLLGMTYDSDEEDSEEEDDDDEDEELTQVNESGTRSLPEDRKARIYVFDHYRTAISMWLHQKYSFPRNADEFEAFVIAQNEIHRILDSIERLYKKHPNFGTYANAAVVLVGIGRQFCFTENLMANGVRNSDLCDRIPEMLMSILEALQWEDEELRELRRYDPKGEGAFESKLMKLISEAKVRGIMEELRFCLMALQNSEVVGAKQGVAGEHGVTAAGPRNENRTRCRTRKMYSSTFNERHNDVA